MHGPDLDGGLTLLETPSPRSAVVHRLVCEHLAEAPGRPAYWIDAGNTASTHALYDSATSRRTLAGLEIARAFTAYQHRSLVETVVRRADARTALLVAPNVAALYHDADLADWEREDLREATCETLSALANALACPVLVTTASAADADRIAAHADRRIECSRTREGIRLEGEDGALTDGYWHGRHWQTTIPYWADLLGTVDRLDPHRPVVDPLCEDGQPTLEVVG